MTDRARWQMEIDGMTCTECAGQVIQALEGVGASEVQANFRRAEARGTLNAIDAWLFNRSLKTFGLRMAQHNQNGQAVAEFLAQHPRVEQVRFPGIPTHPQHALAKEQMRGFGGVLSVELWGGLSAVNTFVNQVKWFTRAVSLGCVESLITQPVAAAHHNVPEAYRDLGGVRRGLIRIAVGI